MARPSMNDPFNQFMALVERDEQYRLLSSEISKNIDLIENLTKQKDLILKQSLSSKILIDESSKDLKNLESDLQQFADRESAIKKAISETISAKDIKILQKELAAIAKPRERTEESLMEALNRFDHANRLNKENEIKVDLLITDIEQKISEAQKNLATINQRLVEFQNVELEISHGVPQQWLDLYRRIRNFITDPVARLVGNSCNACGHTMTTHEVMNVHKLRVVQCPECYRVLYYKP
jgi:predicted  nucleic acid-binding Zn-ribbon protein